MYTVNLFCGFLVQKMVIELKKDWKGRNFMLYAMFFMIGKCIVMYLSLLYTLDTWSSYRESNKFTFFKV